MLHVWRASGEELASLAIEEVGDVKTLKHRLRQLCGFPVCAQQIIHDGDCLEDTTSLLVPMDVQLVLCAAGMDEAAEELIDFAASEGHVAVARYLLQLGVDKDAQSFTSGFTALMCASLDGQVEIVRLLLEAEADMNMKGDRGDTALILASRHGFCHIAQLLVEAGAHKNLKNRRGDTALITASRRGHRDVVRLLLEAGANVAHTASW